VPWSVGKRGSKWCVVKDDDGKVEGCHDSSAAAIKQQRALYASESMAANGDGPDTAELAMVALYPRLEEAEALAVEGGLEVDDLHVTLIFLGEVGTFDEEALPEAVGRVAMSHSPLEGVVGGTGYFSANEDGVPVILLPDVPGLSRVREDIVGELRAQGIESPSEHGFLPHMTQIYVDSVDDAPPRENPLGQALHFDAVSVVIGDRRQDYPLGGEEMSTNTVTVKIIPDFSEWDAALAQRIDILPGTAANAAAGAMWELAAGAVAAVEAGQQWEGILAFEAYPSDGDGGLKRYLMTPLGHRELPLSLMAQFVNEEGHKKAGIAGRIDTIERIPASEFAHEGFDLPDDLPEDAFVHFGTGVFDTGEVGAEAARLVEAKMLRGVSVDLSGTKWVPLDAETFQEIEQNEMGMERMLRGVLAGGKNSKIAGATIVAHPSFGHARVDLVACAFASAEIRLVHEEDLVACAAGPIAPPAEWFANPQFKQQTPVTVTGDGRVSGHIATWDCHMGYENMCMTAKPSRDGYARFHTGTLITDDGTPVKIGRISVAPHAPKRMSPEQVMAYYSDAKKVAAFVCLYEDRFGIACAGVTRSDAPRELLRDFLANPPSGEWRRGELLGISSVPLPGLPVVAPEAYFVASADGGDVTPEMLILPPVEAPEPTEDEMVLAAAAAGGAETLLGVIAG
jgi:2'-5' RNA ligase